MSNNDNNIKVDMTKTITEKMVKLHVLFVFTAGVVFGAMNMMSGDIAVGAIIMGVVVAAAAITLLTKDKIKRVNRGLILSMTQLTLIVVASVVKHEVHGMFPLMIASMVVSGIYFHKPTLIVHWVGMDAVALIGLALRDMFYAGQEYDFLIKGILGINVGAFMLIYLVKVCITNLGTSQAARAEADKLVEQVKAKMEETSAMAEQQKDVVARIATISSTVRTSSDQMLDIASQISSSAEEELANIDEISKEVNDMAAQTQESLAESERAAKAAEESTRLLNESNEEVKQMVHAMGAIEEASSKIRTIVKAIEDIAFQTNILALNASVEAARAGEAGKGFAVVAQEVGSLAGHSQEAVAVAEKSNALVFGDIKKVNDIVTEINDQMTKIEDMMNEVRDNISTTKEKGNDISVAITGVSDINRHVDGLVSKAENLLTVDS